MGVSCEAVGTRRVGCGEDVGCVEEEVCGVTWVGGAQCVCGGEQHINVGGGEVGQVAGTDGVHGCGQFWATCGGEVIEEVVVGRCVVRQCAGWGTEQGQCEFWAVVCGGQVPACLVVGEGLVRLGGDGVVDRCNVVQHADRGGGNGCGHWRVVLVDA